MDELWHKGVPTQIYYNMLNSQISWGFKKIWYDWNWYDYLQQLATCV
jgi:hypothetical protein